MLRTNTALWRVAFLTGLGISQGGCGAQAGDPTAPGTPNDTGATGSGSASDDVASANLPSTTPPTAGTACVASLPQLEHDVDTGLEGCSDGRVHRPEAIECVSKLPRSLPAPAELLPSDSCALDSECTAHPLGHCDELDSEGGRGFGKLCQYGCVTDADCGAAFLCKCGDPVGTCVTAHCRSDADCGSGMLCSQGTRHHALGCPASYEFFCETPADSCRVERDCTLGAPDSSCVSADGARRCQSNADGAICGRPFLVHGSARLARVEASGAWLLAGGPSPGCAGLSAPQRRELARAWARLGSMEHASVAAFARFTLQLLSLGAPAALVEQSQQALADELLHARLCFSLASAYAGEPLGPGPLPTADALTLSSLEDIAALALHEGCVGETSAALEASEALAVARDPAVRAALARIELDERRHAQLAWRFVSWAVRVGGESVRQRIEHELTTLVAEAAASASTADRSSAFDATAHGILSMQQRAELRAAALRDVVLPCAQALLPTRLPTTQRDNGSASVRA